MRRLISRGNRLWCVLIISLAFNIGFGVTFGVRSCRHFCERESRSEGTSLRNLHELLNLTPEQDALMLSAKENLLRQVERVQQELTVERTTLATLLAASEPDRKAIAVQLDKIAALQQQLQRNVVEHLLEEKGVLAPVQQATFNEIIRRRVCPCGAHGPESGSGGCEVGGRQRDQDANETKP
jgi:Spy/CpxP family protein refolding chaperone